MLDRIRCITKSRKILALISTVFLLTGRIDIAFAKPDTLVYSVIVGLVDGNKLEEIIPPIDLVKMSGVDSFKSKYTMKLFAKDRFIIPFQDSYVRAPQALSNDKYLILGIFNSAGKFIPLDETEFDSLQLKFDNGKTIKTLFKKDSEIKYLFLYNLAKIKQSYRGPDGGLVQAKIFIKNQKFENNVFYARRDNRSEAYSSVFKINTKWIDMLGIWFPSGLYEIKKTNSDCCEFIFNPIVFAFGTKFWLSTTKMKEDYIGLSIFSEFISYESSENNFATNFSPKPGILIDFNSIAYLGIRGLKAEYIYIGIGSEVTKLIGNILKAL